MIRRRKFLKKGLLFITGAGYYPVFGHLLSFDFGITGKKMKNLLPKDVIRENLLFKYIREFNQKDYELYPQTIPNDDAFHFLKNNIPLFECPDKEIEKTYYFRWWTFRKHLRKTVDGWVITEFLPKMGHAGKHNTISCPAGHQFREGRWLHSGKFLHDYAMFWFRKGGDIRRYSFWAADSVLEYCKVSGDFTLAKELLPDMVKNYSKWEESRKDPNGLYWQIDVRDGMEVSISGSGYRATINSYQYGDAIAIAKIADMLGHNDLAKEFRQKAVKIRHLLNKNLWDDNAKFYKVGLRTSEQAPKPTGILSWRVNNDLELTQFATPSASQLSDIKNLNALKNSQIPEASDDTSIPRLTLIPRKGQIEWVQYDFGKPVDVTSLQVYWFSNKEYALPREWIALYRRDDDWCPVPARTRNRVGSNSYISLPMDQITTTGLRLEVICQGTKPVVLNHGLHLTDVRELHGYTPWYFEGLAEDSMAEAWSQLMDEKGFFAPFGPTTAEQRHPEFKIAYIGHPCQWNGPSWPFSTSITLTAMANLLNGAPQKQITKKDYFTVLKNYVLSHRIEINNQERCWIDENLNPFTGDWISRTMLQRWNQKPVERGKDYNHSSFCDLIINGLIGIRPQEENNIIINPLLPENIWDWFCLENIKYHEKNLAIYWDRYGEKYKKEKGFSVVVDGVLKFNSEKIEKIHIQI
jgi:hypothetical protein